MDKGDVMDRKKILLLLASHEHQSHAIQPGSVRCMHAIMLVMPLRLSLSHIYPDTNHSASFLCRSSAHSRRERTMTLTASIGMVAPEYPLHCVVGLETQVCIRVASGIQQVLHDFTLLSHVMQQQIYILTGRLEL